jgi:hypothetical protein
MEQKDNTCHSQKERAVKYIFQDKQFITGENSNAFGCGVGSSLDTNEQKQIRQK